jgi:hypothetical protein
MLDTRSQQKQKSAEVCIHMNHWRDQPGPAQQQPNHVVMIFRSVCGGVFRSESVVLCSDREVEKVHPQLSRCTRTLMDKCNFTALPLQLTPLLLYLQALRCAAQLTSTTVQSLTRKPFKEPTLTKWPPTSNLFGRMAMFSGGGIGRPRTEAVRQLSAGINSSAGSADTNKALGCSLLGAQLHAVGWVYICSRGRSCCGLQVMPAVCRIHACWLDSNCSIQPHVGRHMLG